MRNTGKINRRDFIRGAAITGAGLALGGGLLCARRSLAALLAGGQGAIDRAIRDHKLGNLSDADAQATVAAYMEGNLNRPKVIHAHSDTATDWDFGSDYYGNHVDQNVVNGMVDEGMKELTGASTVAQAWQTLLPGYQSGQGIAIKVNFNNCWSSDDNDLQIDALIQPVNAVVRGLKMIGVLEQDVWVYDAVRNIPNRFRNGCLYPAVQFFGPAQFNNNSDPDRYVTFSPPPGTPMPSANKIADVLINATYLIDMPIMKKHGDPGPSLSFKNHFGTINDPASLHDYICTNGSYFSEDYNPLADIYLNPHIGDKTVLILADGLFGSRDGWNAKPAPWVSFNNDAPNSILVSVDPVAIDCVMYDLLEIETDLVAGGDYYLQLAAAAGLGVFEHGSPGGSGYGQIDYRRVEL